MTNIVDEDHFHRHIEADASSCSRGSITGPSMAKKTSEPLVPIEHIARSILVLRGHKVLLDAELAKLYGVTTTRLNQQVRRNRKRFPDDFLLEVTADEIANLKLHFATSSWGGSRKLPLAFTEHGAIMVATILNSPRAVEMSVYVVRAFVKLRELLASNKDLSQKLARLERSLLALDLKTQNQFKEVYEAIQALMVTPSPKKRPIGFTAELEKGS